MIIMQNPANSLKRILFFSILFFLTGCGGNTVIKTDQEINQYFMAGYLSSKKDKLSFDLKIQVDLVRQFYEIKGFDTLLGKERFVVRYQNQDWYFKDFFNQTEGKLDINTSFLDTLPPIIIFDYLQFLQGKVPILKGAEKLSSGEKIIYQTTLYKQEIELTSDQKPIKIYFYTRGEKVFLFEYSDYVILGNKIFPKSLTMIDYIKKKKINWWFSEIKPGGQ